METTRREPALGPIRLLFEVGPVAGLSDGQLLGRFLDLRGDREAAEVAFAAIVERHGPMVLRVCRGRLGDEHDAQDAFQATFLILARKAATIRKHDSAASWLQGVARRVARCARRASALRRAKELRAAAGRPGFAADADRSDLVPAVLEEVGGLPEKYRAPLMLCLLDDLTHEEAAARLGWPVGTVKTRVRRAKDRLRARLTRRGLAPSLVAVAAVLASRQASAMPAALVRSTTRAALQVGILPASVAGLVQLGLGSLMMTRIKFASLGILSVGVLAAGVTSSLARPSPRGEAKVNPPQARPAAKDEAASPKPAEAEAVGEDSIDQVEMAKIDLELLAEKVASARAQIAQYLRGIEVSTSNIERIRGATSVENLLGLIGQINDNEDFQTTKKRTEDRYLNVLDQQQEELKQNRLRYKELRHKLRQEEQKVKEMEARAGSPGPKEPIHADRLDQLKRANIGVDLLRMDVDRWREQLKASHRNLFEVKDRRRRVGLSGGMTEREIDQAENRLGREYQLAERDLVDAEASFLTSSQKLVEGERNLRDLAKDLPETVQAEFFRSIADSKRVVEAKPAADIVNDRRLTDLERKLDQILEALKKK